MKIYTETYLSDFNFWAGAVDRVQYLTNEDFDILEDILTDCYPEGMSDTQINDLFWFEEDTIADWLGYADWEALEENRGLPL